MREPSDIRFVAAPAPPSFLPPLQPQQLPSLVYSVGSSRLFFLDQKNKQTKPKRQNASKSKMTALFFHFSSQNFFLS